MDAADYDAPPGRRNAMHLARTLLGMGLVAVLLADGHRGAQAGPDLADDWLARTKQAKFGLLEALERALKTAGSGVPYEIELEPDGGALVYSVDVAQGKASRNVVLNALTGEVVENVVEPEDNSARVASAGKVGLVAGIQSACGLDKGTPFYAVLVAREPAPGILVLVVGSDGKVAKVWVDGATGAASVAGTPPERAFTDTFPEDRADLGPTGRNKYLFLEPGLFWVLEGKEDGKTLRVTCTMLAETKTIDGVECRALEVKEELDGVVKEVTRDYHAISKKTGNVYYFGEDVDVYEDGKMVGHEGAWLAGKEGARWGLFVPAIPLLGARYYQEIAPKVALDRAEITGLAEVVETPAGTFRGVLRLEETNPLEPGHRDVKYFAPEVGFLVKEEGNLLLARHGKK
jgi:hypothetical protein